MFGVIIVCGQNKKIDTLLITLINEEKVCTEVCDADTNLLKTLNILSKEYRYMGEYENAAHFANSAIQHATLMVGGKNISVEAIKFAKSSIASAYNNLGSVYDDEGDYAKAIDYYLKSLKINEELSNNIRKAAILGNIGVVYRNLKNYPKALEYYFMALKINEQVGNKNGITIRLTNIGNVYNSLKDANKALEFYFKALKMTEELNDKKSKAVILGNMGGIYQQQNNYAKALESYFLALDMQKELNSKSGMAVNLGNIGALYTEQKKYNEGEKYLLKAIELTTEIKALDLTKQFELLISKLYDETGDYKKALEHHHAYTFLKDSIYNTQSNRHFNEMTTKYESEKREQELKLIKIAQEKERVLTASENKRHQLLLLLISAIAIAIALIAIIVFRALRITRKQKHIIELQSEEVSKQKQLIEENQKEILDSIHYAKRIQIAHLPSDKKIENSLNRLNKKA